MREVRLESAVAQDVDLFPEIGLMACNGFKLVSTENNMSWKRPRVAGETSPCAHECVHHAAVLNPAMWGHLPKELLKLIFARLPLSDISCLRYLSKEWNWNLNSKYSEFKRLCADAYPNVFGFISADLKIKRFLVRVCDMKSNVWHTHQMDSGIRPVVGFEKMQCASDGGLVCFLGRQQGHGCGAPIIFVCNPLTQEKETLPPNSLMSYPIMLNLIMMDYKRTYYKVIVVGANVAGGLGSPPFVEIFYSKTGRWTKSSIGDGYHMWHIVGYQYNGEGSVIQNEYTGRRLPPHVYDTATERLHEFPVPVQVHEATVTDWALVGLRLFVLYENHEWSLRRSARYYISEFEWEENFSKWIKLKDHAFSGLGNPPPLSEMYTSIYACRGFVLVGQHRNNSFRNCYHFQNRLNRLYDLSTGIWHALPALSRGEEFHHTDMMCELRWDVVP